MVESNHEHLYKSKCPTSKAKYSRQPDELKDKHLVDTNLLNVYKKRKQILNQDLTCLFISLIFVA